MRAEDLNRIYTIPQLWAMLGVAGEVPRVGQKVCSPFRPDKNPSFAIFDGGFKARDFSLGVSYSAIDFFGAARGIPPERQVIEFWNWIAAQGRAEAPSAPHTRGPQIGDIDNFRKPTEAECRAIGAVRKIAPGAVALAGNWGTLRIGQVYGFDSWVLTDSARLVAEARRIDRQPYPGERPHKAHTFKGSKKSWPVGLWVPEIVHIPRVLLVEGGPDYLAGIELVAMYGQTDAIVCTMLGTENSISATPLQRLARKIVRIISHCDESRAGFHAARRWEDQLKASGCQDHEIVWLPAGFDDLNDFMAKAGDDEKTQFANWIYGKPK